jgi:hypothetical protein
MKDLDEGRGGQVQKQPRARAYTNANGEFPSYTKCHGDRWRVTPARPAALPRRLPNVGQTYKNLLRIYLDGRSHLVTLACPTDIVIYFLVRVKQAASVDVSKCIIHFECLRKAKEKVHGAMAHASVKTPNQFVAMIEFRYQRS